MESKKAYFPEDERTVAVPARRMDTEEYITISFRTRGVTLTTKQHRDNLGSSVEAILYNAISETRYSLERTIEIAQRRLERINSAF